MEKFVFGEKEFVKSFKETAKEQFPQIEFFEEKTAAFKEKNAPFEREPAYRIRKPTSIDEIMQQNVSRNRLKDVARRRLQNIDRTLNVEFKGEPNEKGKLVFESTIKEEPGVTIFGEIKEQKILTEDLIKTKSGGIIEKDFGVGKKTSMRELVGLSRSEKLALRAKAMTEAKKGVQYKEFATDTHLRILKEKVTGENVVDTLAVGKTEMKTGEFTKELPQTDKLKVTIEEYPEGKTIIGQEEFRPDLKNMQTDMFLDKSKTKTIKKGGKVTQEIDLGQGSKLTITGKAPMTKVEIESKGVHFIDENKKPWKINTKGEISFPEKAEVGLKGKGGGGGGTEIKPEESIGGGGGGQEIVRVVTDEERLIPVGGKKSFGSKEQVVAVVVKEVAKGSIGDVSLVGGTRDVGRLEFKFGTEKFDNYNYSKGRFGLKERRARRAPLYELEYEQPSTYWKGIAPSLGVGVAPSLAIGLAGRRGLSYNLDIGTWTGTREEQLTGTKTELGTIYLGGTRLDTELGTIGETDITKISKTDIANLLGMNFSTILSTDLGMDLGTETATEQITQQTTEQLTTQVTVPQLVLITPTILTPDITTPRMPRTRPRPPEPETKIPRPPWIPFGGGEEEAEKKKVKTKKEEGTAYDVLVKERSMYHGKILKATRFAKVNRQPLTEGGAMALGGQVADTTSAISFKLRRTQGKAQAGTARPFEAIKHKFTKKGEVWIEQPEYRMDTPGEVKGISELGWQSNKFKGQMTKLRGLKANLFGGSGLNKTDMLGSTKIGNTNLGLKNNKKEKGGKRVKYF
jgi:hypothetical protein